VSSCPDACSAEEVVTEDFSYIAWVILEPFEVELADAFDFMLLVLLILSQIYTEVTMMPVCVICIV
jgi:hypothetical protein